MSRRSVAVFALCAAAGLACGASAQRPATTATERACSAGHAWNGRTCAPLSRDMTIVERGERQLAELQPEEAIQTLESARGTGPYKHADLVRIYEQLSVAYAYLENEAQALSLFDMVLALAPGHAISYTLSPKATFLFEKARVLARSRPRPEVRVSWPRDITVDDEVPIEVEVLADPKAFLRRARLHTRKRGQSSFTVRELKLPPVGSYARLTLPPVAPGATTPAAVDVYLTAHDESGNEVLLWGSSARPREIPLAYDPVTPWYRKWWVWGIAGGVVAATTGVMVYAATREPGDLVGGSASLR